jgi:hypothetical protein
LHTAYVRKQFFFEKKNQKTFVCWVTWLIGPARNEESKSFLVLFFKKELLSLALGFLGVSHIVAQYPQGGMPACGLMALMSNTSCTRLVRNTHKAMRKKIAVVIESDDGVMVYAATVGSLAICPDRARRVECMDLAIHQTFESMHVIAVIEVYPTI